MQLRLSLAPARQQPAGPVDIGIDDALALHTPAAAGI
jgi:hypothetical protein